MERLTYNAELCGVKCWQVKGADNLMCGEVCLDQKDKGCKDCPIAAAFEKLARYEDTGLEPFEVEQMQGRMPPCKVDEVIFDIDLNQYIIASIEWFNKRLIRLHCYEMSGMKKKTFSIGKKSIGKTVFLDYDSAVAARKKKLEEVKK